MQYSGATIQELSTLNQILGLSVNYSKSQVIWIDSKRQSTEMILGDTDWA
jgi:hypothetical protein